MRLARASVPVLLLVLFGLLAHTYAGKSAIKASAFVTTYSELNEQEEIKLLAQVTEAFFKQGWAQTPQNYIAQIANQAKISGYKLETSELPGLADKLAALINKVRTESVPLEGNASAQSPPSYPATNTVKHG